MRLIVTTPTEIVVDAAGARHLRAEDETGSFGIEPKHADFLTVLSVSVVSYQDAGGVERFVAVHGGVLSVRAGTSVEIATSEALVGDDLETLRKAVISRYRDEANAEKAARTRATKLHLLAIRKIYSTLRGESGAADSHLGGGAGQEMDS
ncbi:MAG: F0F1 ATP synthase subunit epsilon [Polyangiales bacterium]